MKKVCIVVICFIMLVSFVSCGSKEREIVDMADYYSQHSITDTTLEVATEQVKQSVVAIKTATTTTTTKIVPKSVTQPKATQKVTQKATQKVAQQNNQPKATQKATQKQTAKVTPKTTSKPTVKTTQATTRRYRLGDVDRDGKLTTLDLATLRYRLNLGRSMSDIKDVADMDGNGKINQLDLDLLMKEVAKHNG